MSFCESDPTVRVEYRRMHTVLVAVCILPGRAVHLAANRIAHRGFTNFGSKRQGSRTKCNCN